MAEKYDSIGKEYNATRKADPYITNRIVHFLKPEATGVYLDLGCGTGNYTIALNSTGVDMIGADPSYRMLETAKSQNNKIRWIQGKAEKLPIKDGSINGVIATLTIHHWGNLTKGFSEVYRVLKPGGRLVIFTSTPQQMKGYWLNHYFPEMMRSSIKQMPSLKEVEQSLKITNLDFSESEPYNIQADLKDLFLYAGKYNPEFYLDDTNRNGISSFTSLANANEIKEGLKKLSIDIETKRIQEIMEKYQNNGGDYLFICATKVN